MEELVQKIKAKLRARDVKILKTNEDTDEILLNKTLNKYYLYYED